MVKTVGVIGAGQMGNGIAHVFALSEYNVIICDINEDALKKAISTIEKNLGRQVSKEIISELYPLFKHLVILMRLEMRIWS